MWRWLWRPRVCPYCRGVGLVAGSDGRWRLCDCAAGRRLMGSDPKA
jgi:hypothetical protein